MGSRLSSLVVIMLLTACNYSFATEDLRHPAAATYDSKNPETLQTEDTAQPPSSSPETPVEERAQKESELKPDNFAITLYKPTYILPLYYTGSPYDAIYAGNTPNNEGIKKAELKYQLSFKVPVWRNILKRRSTLYLAYTQLSYWQAYNRVAFFRETDYEPELYLANEVNWCLFGDWKFNFINIGAIHQSNGFGNELERSWNRVYLEVILSSNDNWMFSLKPWIVFHDRAFREHNPNIADYLGYGRILIAYKIGRQVIALQAHNIIESGAKHASGELTWSFPITSYINGYLQVFSGYGQSLIEYDHRTNSAGIGLTLNNWI